jgi:hypothetical protein
MRRTEQDDLLKALLPGEESAQFRRVSLELGLKAMAARRTRRQVLRACAGCSLLLALAGTVLWPWRPGHWTARKSVVQLPDVATAPASAATGSVKFISDDELMALFPNQAVALIGKPGHQQFVFLDVRK